jgi:hypothetical protein
MASGNEKGGKVIKSLIDKNLNVARQCKRGYAPNYKSYLLFNLVRGQ